MFKSKPDQTSDGEATFEKVQLFEGDDMRTVFLVKSGGHVKANLKLEQGATKEDAESYMAQHFQGCKLECLSDVLYEELATGKWDAVIASAREAGLSSTPAMVRLANVVHGRCASPGFAVLPIDPAKQAAFVAKQNAELHAAATKPIKSSVHPKLRSAISALERAERDIEELRREIAAEQNEKISKMIEAQPKIQYVNAHGVPVNP